MNRFWSPVIGTQGPVLISAGSIMFATDPKIGMQVGDKLQDNSYLSFENGLAMGRVAALVNVLNADYRIQSATETTLAQIRESPAVFVGAYNNLWSQRLLAPLRFHLLKYVWLVRLTTVDWSVVASYSIRTTLQ